VEHIRGHLKTWETVSVSNPKPYYISSGQYIITKDQNIHGLDTVDTHHSDTYVLLKHTIQPFQNMLSQQITTRAWKLCGWISIIFKCSLI